MGNSSYVKVQQHTPIRAKQGQIRGEELITFEMTEPVLLNSEYNRKAVVNEGLGAGEAPK